MTRKLSSACSTKTSNRASADRIFFARSRAFPSTAQSDTILESPIMYFRGTCAIIIIEASSRVQNVLFFVEYLSARALYERNGLVFRVMSYFGVKVEERGTPARFRIFWNFRIAITIFC